MLMIIIPNTSPMSHSSNTNVAFITTPTLPLTTLRLTTNTPSRSPHPNSTPNMSTMLALHQHSYRRAAITLGHLPVPVPPPSHVLIRVHAAALNPIDLKRSGSEIFPIVMGYDVAGVVHALGQNVTQWKVGDRVFADVMSQSLGPKVTGSIAQFCACPVDMLARVPDNIDMTQAAAVPLVAQTAIQAFRILSCRPGHRVFISGGAGGVGIHAIQIAKSMFRASHVATTASAAKLDFVKQYGADIAIDYRTEDAGDVLKEWADVVLDCTAETDMGKRILRQGGDIVSIADFSKPDVKSFALEPSMEMMARVAAMLEDRTLKPVIDKVYNLPDWEAAIQHLAAGHARGKILFQVA